MANDNERRDIDKIAAWRSMLIAHSRALRAIEADLMTAGAIPLTWYDVLLELNASDQPLRMQAISERVVLSRTRISRLVTELETCGYIERRSDPDDGRSTLVAITGAGRAALAHAAPVYMDGIDRHFTQYLTASQQRSIAKGLDRVLQAHADNEIQR